MNTPWWSADIPICGTDGISYTNECEFNKMKCQNPKCLEDHANCIQKKCRGKCPCPAGCNLYNFDGRFCDYLEESFCGSDNITYRSDCEFKTAKCESLGLFDIELTVKCNHSCPCRKGIVIICKLSTIYLFHIMRSATEKLF